jgi:hypothetical protein
VEPISERIAWKESLVSHLRKRRKPKIGRKLRSKKFTELKQQKMKVSPSKEVVVYRPHLATSETLFTLKTLEVLLI